VGTGGATGGHNAAGSSAPGAAGQSGNVPSNHHVNLSHLETFQFRQLFN
jgi:hypothetical protein